MPAQTTLQMRRGTASSWTSTNPTLAAGEIGFESDTNRFKIGTGSSTWNALPYAASAIANSFVYSATSGQTTFSGADANGNTLAYTVGAEQVYLNGVLLRRTSDYTATNGTSVVLGSGATASDVLTVIAFSTFTVSSDIPKSTLSAKGSLVSATAASTPSEVTVGTDGSILMANSGSTSGLAWAGYAPAGKNAVINGGMDVWQRGTSFTNGSTNPYSADRWQISSGSATGRTWSRQTTSDTTNLPNIQYCMRVARDSGNTATNDLSIINTFETVNSIPFAGKAITISYYARAGANYSAASSNLRIRVFQGTGTDQNAFIGGYTGQSTLLDANSVLTTTWQRFTHTVTVATSTTELQIAYTFLPVGTAGANDWFEITGIQLELGSVATPFARTGGTIQGELAACQRYFNSIDCSLNANAFLGVGVFTSTTNLRASVALPVPMRVKPSVSFSAGNTFLAQDGGNYTGSAVAADQLGINNIGVNLTISGGTAYRAGILLGNSTSGTISVSAEL